MLSVISGHLTFAKSPHIDTCINGKLQNQNVNGKINVFLPPYNLTIFDRESKKKKRREFSLIKWARNRKKVVILLEKEEGMLSIETEVNGIF